jgi:hypothetical protein
MPSYVGASNVVAQGPLPRPNVHANLPTTGDRESGVQVTLVTSAVCMQVWPKHCVARDGPERHTVLVGLVAIDELTPFLVVRRIEHGEVGPSPRYVLSGDVGEEGALSISTQGRRRVDRVGKPVGVKVVVLALGIPDQLHWFHMRARNVKALE